MKKFLLSSLAFVATAIIMVACEKKVGKDPDKVVNQCDTVKYAKHIKPIIEQNCAISGCHVQGGTGNGVFNDYAAIKQKVESGAFKKRVIDGTGGFMPPSGRLPQAQITMIQCWLDKGAPND